nr:MAG TPA: hypothetical protein [Caudoviricetes sp.]
MRFFSCFCIIKRIVGANMWVRYRAFCRNNVSLCERPPLF